MKVATNLAIVAAVLSAGLIVNSGVNPAVIENGA
jgi:hypothetical protein